jgi:PKHD-type hydroxylase
MLITIPELLLPWQVAELRALIDAAEWVDGNATSGAQSALAKRNEQLPEASPAHRKAGAMILDALGASPLFVAAALPLKVFPPLFNRYGEGQAFGDHVDNAVRIQRGSDFRIRSDLSMTVFLEDPDAYDGGELEIDGLFGGQGVKLPAGHAVLYPSSSLHRVTPVTRGRRVASFFWIQSMVRDDGQRRILFDLDRTIQRLVGQLSNHDRSVIELTAVYHNLLRQWADA